ncbi:MAG: MrpF/PhaF family protein [Gammaproteobacteria bacterium]|nr:MrpF/PhaF family protein [Gammaproteobacteria bacterium]MDE0280972.1 MrpF/PhaF family protein [Gammaproteobacteria bacterium]MDE0715804.1 MrpF/PhaF family protein [Gammaproteobacteria bacterium]MXY64545.1 pH regulation protein F [Gammaproteobacteria bacterium]MYG65898.1 pH regulation protein F [Gammaproteobacteria bacterium]
MVLAITIGALLAIMLLALARALAGPKVYDRILAMNMFGTKTVLLIAVYGIFTDSPSLVDLSIFYALINFIGVIAVLKFIERVEEYDEVVER